MASILFGRTKLYEPSPRFSHCAASLRGKCYIWGGRVSNFTKHGRRSVASTIEIFDPQLEIWEKHPTSGVPPPGLHGRAYASLLDSLYWFGGYDGSSFYNSLHRLDPSTLEWRELQPLNQADGPMRKFGCSLVPFHHDKLAIFGGYGIPTGPFQHGATFTKNTHANNEHGWSNDLHVFDTAENKWYSPPIIGQRPPPCSAFSFTAINNHQAVLFGGNQPEQSCQKGYRKVNDCYFMDFESMEWTVLEKIEGAPWPVERSGHAACCLNFGEEHPRLLITGGGDENDNTLSDAWILDVTFGRWQELILPEDVQARMFHTATALCLGPGWTQVTMFGGCPKWEFFNQQGIAKTTVLEFESVESQSSHPTKEWVLINVADSSLLGSVQRIKEKMVRMQRAIQEVEAILQKPHSLDQIVQNMEARAQDLQTQLQASQAACQEFRQLLQTKQQSLLVLQQSLQTTQAHREALEKRVTTAEQSALVAEERVQVLQQTVDEGNTQIEYLQQRVREAEHRTEEVERRTLESRQGTRVTESEPTWVVRRDEIIFTDQEIGRGGWAIVKVAKFRATSVAAKCPYGQIVSNYNRLLFIREMNMAARVRHPNLLQFIGATLHGELIILTELMPTSVRKELENERTFNPNQITSISLDVAKALNYLHLMCPSPIIHRDISSANVLLESGPSNNWRAKVSDYGSVNLLQRLRTATPGNPTYAAPESQNAALQSTKMDIFSFGVLLVEMCTGRFPDVADREHLIQSIQQPNMIALIRRCLTDERNARPSASDIITELSTPHNM